MVRGEDIVLDDELQEEGELPDKLFDLILSIHDGDGEGVW